MRTICIYVGDWLRKHSKHVTCYAVLSGCCDNCAMSFHSSIDVSRFKKMGEPNRIVLGGAFLAGVLVTIALTELHRKQFGAAARKSNVSSRDEELLNSVRSGPPVIAEGVEGCIGNTPLFRIKSLSDETGCEILAKAEVRACNIAVCIGSIV